MLEGDSVEIPGRAEVAQVMFGRSRQPRTVTRHLLEEDNAFNADANAPTLHRQRQLALMDLRNDVSELYHDPAEEFANREPLPSQNELNQFRADIVDQGLRAAIKALPIKGPSDVQTRIERTTQARTAEHDEEQMRLRLQSTAIPAFQRLALAEELARKRQEAAIAATPAAAAVATALAADDDTAAALRRQPRPRIVPRPSDAPVAPLASQAITLAELTSMLAPTPAPNVPDLLMMPDLAQTDACLRPHLYMHEADRLHVNALELIESLVLCGCLFMGMQTLHAPHPITEALDRSFMAPFIYRPSADGTAGHTLDNEDEFDATQYAINAAADANSSSIRPVLLGGHEHYDYTNQCTHLIVLTFACVRRTKAMRTANIDRSRHEAPLLGQEDTEYATTVAQDMARARSNRVDTTDDTDDKYDGGNDIADPTKYYCYKVRVVCVEARDEACANRIFSFDDNTVVHAAADDDEDQGSEPERPAAAAAAAPTADTADAAQPRNDMEAYQFGAPDDTRHDHLLPIGAISLTARRAKVLVGKYRSGALLGWLNGTAAPRRLCIRAYHISAD